MMENFCSLHLPFFHPFAFGIICGAREREKGKNEQVTLLTLWQWTQVIIKFTLTFLWQHFFHCSYIYLALYLMNRLSYSYFFLLNAFTDDDEKMRTFNFSHKFFYVAAWESNKKMYGISFGKRWIMWKTKRQHKRMEEYYVQFVYSRLLEHRTEATMKYTS